METFVLRLRSVAHSQTESGLRGVLHHVRTGEEIRFDDLRQLEALLVERMDLVTTAAGADAHGGAAAPGLAPDAAGAGGDPDPALAPQPS